MTTRATVSSNWATSSTAKLKKPCNPSDYPQVVVLNNGETLNIRDLVTRALANREAGLGPTANYEVRPRGSRPRLSE